MTKKKSNLPSPADYLNTGSKINFLSVFTHSRDRYIVTSEYVTDEWLWSLRQCIQLASITSIEFAQ